MGGRTAEPGDDMEYMDEPDEEEQQEFYQLLLGSAGCGDSGAASGVAGHSHDSKCKIMRFAHGIVTKRLKTKRPRV